MNHQYPGTGEAFVEQHGEQLRAKAAERRLAARAENAVSKSRRPIFPASRKLAIAFAVVLLAGLIVASVALAGASGGGGGGGMYLVM